MSDTCLSCGGLIMEPNKTYGYAGPVCYCPKDPRHQYQRPASKEKSMNPPPPIPAPEGEVLPRGWVRLAEHLGLAGIHPANLYRTPIVEGSIEYLSKIEHEQLMAAEKQRGLRAVEEALRRVRDKFREDYGPTPRGFGEWIESALLRAEARAAKEPSNG